MVLKKMSLFEINNYSNPQTCESLHKPRPSLIELQLDCYPYIGND